jgi:hypothetical protein
MQKIIDFLKKYGWKGLVVLILGACCAFLLTTANSCSAIRAGYERTRYIESVDSTYIHYRPSAQNVELDRVTRARVTRVRDVRVRSN